MVHLSFKTLEFYHKENEKKKDLALQKLVKYQEESIIWFTKQTKKYMKERRNVKLRDKQAIGGFLRLLPIIRDATVWAHIFQSIRFCIILSCHVLHQYINRPLMPITSARLFAYLEGAKAGPSVTSEMSPLSTRSTVHPVTRRATVSTKARSIINMYPSYARESKRGLLTYLRHIKQHSPSTSS